MQPLVLKFGGELLEEPSRMAGANDSSVFSIKGGPLTSGRSGVPSAPIPMVAATAVVSICDNTSM